MFDEDLLQMTLDTNPAYFGDEDDFTKQLMEDDNETEGCTNTRGDYVSTQEDPGRHW